MPSIMINNESLNFQKIIYVDSTNGSDLNDGTELLPYKTIVKQLRMIDQDDTCIKLQGGMIYSENNQAIPGSYGEREKALFSTLYEYNFSVVGDKDIPIIQTTGGSWYDTHMLNLHSSKETKIFNINFYNICYDAENEDKTIFSILGCNYKHEVSFNNCQFIRFNKLFYFDSNTGQPNIYFNNCVQKSTELYYAEGQTNVYMKNSQFKFNSLASSYGIPFISTKTIFNILPPSASGIPIHDSDMDIDVSNYNILNQDYLNVGDGVNPDGTVSHIGLYGGLYALGEWISTKFLLRINNQLKKFNDQNNTFEDIQDNLLTQNNFDNFGFDSVSDLFLKIKQYENISSNFQLYSSSILNDANKLNGSYNLNHNTIGLKSIDISNSVNIDYMRLYLQNLSNLNDIKLFFKKDSSYVSLKNNKIHNIPLNNITNELNNLLSIYEFNNLTEHDIRPLVYDNILNVYLYIKSTNKINNISLKSDIIGKFNSKFINFQTFNNKIVLNLDEDGQYKIYIKKL